MDYLGGGKGMLPPLSNYFFFFGGGGGGAGPPLAPSSYAYVSGSKLFYQTCLSQYIVFM